MAVDDEDPALRMQFGCDTVCCIKAKDAFVANELTRWRHLYISTDATP